MYVHVHVHIPNAHISTCAHTQIYVHMCVCIHSHRYSQTMHVIMWFSILMFTVYLQLCSGCYWSGNWEEPDVSSDVLVSTYCNTIQWLPTAYMVWQFNMGVWMAIYTNQMGHINKELKYKVHYVQVIDTAPYKYVSLVLVVCKAP